MDPTVINDTLALITRVVGLGKKATHLDYEEALQAAREAILQQKELNLNLRDENRSLKEKLVAAEEYVLERGVYWEAGDTERDQPFCPSCYSKGNIVPLQKLWNGYDKKQSPWTCPDAKCKATFNPWDYKEPEDDESAVVWDNPLSHQF